MTKTDAKKRKDGNEKARPSVSKDANRAAGAKLWIVSLGCDKNQVDTQQMMALLSEAGYGFAEEAGEADAAVVNSCCFIGDAKEESIQEILELGELKKNGKLKAIIVAGCLAQRYSGEIRESLPEVDAVVGTASFPRIVEAVDEALSGRGRTILDPLKTLPYVPEKRILTHASHYAYLKIAEGCSKQCSYCVIPSVRGRYRSVPEETLIRDAEALAGLGAVELILIAQETTLYGTDLYGEKKLPRLLERLSEIPEIKWIRLMYCYPEEITEELVDAIAGNEKVCHYLDLPIQHASGRILRDMGRKTTRAGLSGMVRRLRERIPDIALRTTLITGFPGETEEEHEELMGFVEEMRFDRLGVFPYSREEGTRAYDMPGQVPKRVKLRRRKQLMELQQRIAFEKAGEMAGKTVKVLVEGRLPEEKTYVGRTYKDAPEVDAYVFFPDRGRTYLSGEMLEVRIRENNGYDLIGDVIDEDESAE